MVSRKRGKKQNTGGDTALEVYASPRGSEGLEYVLLAGDSEDGL